MKLFELYAELGLDSAKFNKGVTSATKQGQSMATNLSTGMQKISAKTIALGNAMYDMGKQAARAVANFAKDAVETYAEAEQLLGGVETLFKGSASTVIENARNAYTTAGMDANQYMQTVMGFSSSLLQSVGGDTVKAAQYADMAIRDMSDNANKFGTDMASIENAYQGFAKQNYTLLDNLRLGYGGTKTEMQRLLKDAQKIQRAQGNNVRYSINNLSDIYDAIHVIQESMGITGTTSEEAARTIAGSFNSFKASWKNLVIGLGTGQEMDILVENLFTTGTTLLHNISAIAPRIGQQVLHSFDSILEKYDLYRTLREAYKVGKWQGLASAAVSAFKKGVSGFGDWALEHGSQILAALYNAITGDTVTAEKIKGYMTELFGGVNVIFSGVTDTAKSALQWIKENGDGVSTVITAMAVAFTALQVATNPLGVALAAIIAFGTDWEEFEKTAPGVVAFFEDLAGIDFGVFVESLNSIKSALGAISDFITQHPEIASAVATLGAAAAVATGHPVAAAGALALGVNAANEADAKAAKQEQTMDAWAESKGYTRDQKPFFLIPAFSYGEADYAPEVYEEYHKERIQNAIDQLKNATPSGTPATITGPGGKEVPLMPSGDAGAALERIAAAAEESAAAASEAAAAATNAAGALSGAQIVMDSQVVGELVTPTVAAGVYRQIQTKALVQA